MKKMSSWLYAAAITTSLISTSSIADWAVENDQSSVHFISTKNEHVAEIHHFKQVSGELNENGMFSLAIDLASVETGIDIRNTRMRDELFKVGTFPSANLTATLPKTVMQLEAGESMQAEIAAKLSLMQTVTPLTLHIQISKTKGNSYVASSIQPVLVSAENVGLKQGVETLQKLAGLPSIGLTVPVSFNLVLKAD